MYLCVVRSIYRFIYSDLLWCKVYYEILQNNLFSINPYERWVANRVINWKQRMLEFYVDDNKVSYEETKAVDEILGNTEEACWVFNHTTRKEVRIIWNEHHNNIRQENSIINGGVYKWSTRRFWRKKYRI